MMKLVYKLQAEEFKFEIPVIHLPVRTIPLYQRPSIQPVILANTVSPFLSLTLTFYLSHFRFPSPLCPQPPIVPGSNKGLYPGRGPAWLSSVPQQAAPSSDWSLEPNTGSEYPSFMFTHVSSHITTCHSRQASSTFLQILLSFTCFTLPPVSSNQGWVCLILTVIKNDDDNSDMNSKSDSCSSELSSRPTLQHHRQCLLCPGGFIPEVLFALWRKCSSSSCPSLWLQRLSRSFFTQVWLHKLCRHLQIPLCWAL